MCNLNIILNRVWRAAATNATGDPRYCRRTITRSSHSQRTVGVAHGCRSQRPSFVGGALWFRCGLCAEPITENYGRHLRCISSIDATLKTLPINTSAKHEKAQYSVYSVARPTTGMLAWLDTHTQQMYTVSRPSKTCAVLETITRHSYSVANPPTKRNRVIVVQSTQSFLTGTIIVISMIYNRYICFKFETQQHQFWNI